MPDTMRLGLAETKRQEMTSCPFPVTFPSLKSVFILQGLSVSKQFNCHE